jgi:pyrimidine operon attenuation protein/uracil phosphoribosyltransferase
LGGKAEGEYAVVDKVQDLIVRRHLMDEVAMGRAIRRLGHQLVESVQDVSNLALVGIRTRGVPLAKRLQTVIAAAEGIEPPVGELDITLYRDDVFEGMPIPEVRPTHLPFGIAGRTLVLVDDVLYTGRTIRAALDGLMDWGRPRCIRLAVLVDRGHRELPVHADYAGLTVETLTDESVQVRLVEIDGVDEVILRGAKSEGSPS